MPEPMVGPRGGWFADMEYCEDEYCHPIYDKPIGWTPCFDTGNGLIFNFEIWFQTRLECEEFIDEIIETGRIP